MERGRPPSFVKRLNNCSVSEGNRVHLMCSAIGNPDPEIYWTKNGEKLFPGHRATIRCVNGIATLEMHAARVEDSGYYVCFAKNCHGQSSTESSVKVFAVYESPLPSSFVSPIRGSTFAPIDKLFKKLTKYPFQTRTNSPITSSSWNVDSDTSHRLRCHG